MVLLFNIECNMRDITHIFIHCTGTLPSVQPKAIINGFRQRGWKHPGYHYLIDFDGNVHRLCGEEEVANGVRGFNQHAIHMAYIGGIDKEGRPCDTRTPWQNKTMMVMAQMLSWRYPDARVLGHCKVNPRKACPCFDVEIPSWNEFERQRKEEERKARDAAMRKTVAARRYGQMEMTGEAVAGRVAR